MGWVTGLPDDGLLVTGGARMRAVRVVVGEFDGWRLMVVGKEGVEELAGWRMTLRADKGGGVKGGGLG